MLRHLLKLVWNRRRGSMLLVLEIFFSFLATAVVTTLCIFCWDNYRQPLGFDYHDVWAIDIGSLHRRIDHGPEPGMAARVAALLAEVRALPPVLAASGTAMLPYGVGEDRSASRFEQGLITYDFQEVTRDFDQVLRLHVVAGRWFRRGDETLAWQPVVINQSLARAAFRDADPIGRRFGLPSKSGDSPERRVIGVIDDYRLGGELTASKRFLFTLHEPGTNVLPLLANLAIRVRPGTPAAFEEQLLGRLRAVAPDWTFTVEPLVEARESSFRVGFVVLLIGTVIATFLLVMIGLGMVGVVWQNLLRRTREIGLRRAAGATRGSVSRQIVGEQLLLTTIGVAAGLLLLAQVPLLPGTDFLSARVLVLGIATAVLAIYLLVTVCTLHPSILASRVQPVEALRYE